MYTKRSAETMTCPIMVREKIVPRTAGGPSTAVATSGIACIAAACMMWRWSVSFECPECGLTFGQEGNCTSNRHEKRAVVPRGYCGLGGRP